MARDIRTKAHLQGGEIRTKANFGQTVAITVLPDPYEGQTTVTPSDEQQTLPTRGKTVPVDIAVLPAPVESLATSENGTFLPSSGNVGFSEVVVDVEPSLESLSVTENGLYLPESGTDGFDRVSVDVPAPVLEPLTVDALSQRGTIMPTGDGFSQVTVEEQWDGILYPITDETDPIYDSKPFDAHWVQLSAGDTIIIEGYGRGRWVGFRGITTVNISSLPATVSINVRSQPAGQFDYLRFRFDAVEDCIAVLAGTNGSKDGTHSAQVGYCFCGEYLRWKVIHAS